MNKRRIYLWVLVLILVAALLVLTQVGNLTTHAVNEFNEKAYTYEWVKDNCDCVERERLYCRFDGFEVDEKGRCKNGTDVTSPILGCSKYDCAGQEYIVDENVTDD